MYTFYNGDILEQLSNVPNESVDLVITDPPYGVLRDGKTGWGLGYKPADWDVFSSQEKFTEFTKAWFNKLRTKLKPNSYIFIFWSQKYLHLGLDIFKPHRTIIWRYNNLINNPKGDFAYDYEPIFVIKVGEPRLSGTSRAVLEYSKPQSNFVKDKAIYPTQKPRALISHLLDVVGLPKGALVMDCFQGSGVVGEQAVLKGYDYIGIDSSEDSQKISERLLSIASGEPIQLSMFDLEEIQRLEEKDKRVHYFITRTSDGKQKKYKRALAGLWYDRDVKLLMEQIKNNGEEITEEFIK